MSGNSFGQIFKITTCGESHGGAIAVIVDGCPPGLLLSEPDIQQELDRRKPGQNAMTTSRQETDTIQIMSGVFEGVTTGMPILLVANNKDMRPEDYMHMKNIFRPSHADYTYLEKYGIRDFRGSGRASARETLARVAAGAIAKKYLYETCGIKILSYVEQVGHIQTSIDPANVTPEMIDLSMVRCPDKPSSDQMIDLIKKITLEGDSIGGIIKGVIRNVPVGLGEPVFDKLSADLAKAMMSINAVKGFEIGSGFSCVNMRGSQHNDLMTAENNKIAFKTNNAGGIVGGISTGQDIFFRVAFKPVASIRQPQETIDIHQNNITLAIEGRHDACVLPRAVPIVDAMAAIVLMDHYLRDKVYQ